MRYSINGLWSYGVIVNQTDLLFNYRLPCNRTSDGVLQSLVRVGLNASRNARGEIEIRVTSVSDAELILKDCFSGIRVESTLDTNGTDWNDEELRASIHAYRQMQQLQREGQIRYKKEIYRELAQKFSRSEKAFEFRMQNISAVLAMLGREWIDGLKPAANVGTGVALRLEGLINEIDGAQTPPRIGFEVTVREKVTRPPSARPVGVLAPERTNATMSIIKRDPSVKAWVLNRAKGVCECCKCDAPFFGIDGSSYLEVHHLRQLADGGSDRITNAAALCPNCHRRMHFGKDATAMRMQTYAHVPELKVE